MLDLAARRTCRLREGASDLSRKYSRGIEEGAVMKEEKGSSVDTQPPPKAAAAAAAAARARD